MKNKVKGAIDKIADKADALGAIYGFIQYPMHEGFALFIPKVQGALEGWKFKDPIWITNMLLQNEPQRSQFMGNVMAGIGGWALKEFGPVIGGGIGGTVGKVGGALMKFGLAAAISNWIGAFVWLPQFNPHANVGTSASSTATTSGRIPYPMTHVADYPPNGIGRWRQPAA